MAAKAPVGPRLVASRPIVERIAVRARFLPPSERLLLEQIYIHGWPAARIGALTGERPRMVRLRVRRLAKRVLSPAFVLVTGDETSGGALSSDLRALGAAVFVRGLSVRRAAAEQRIPYWRALQMVRAIRTIAPAAAARTGIEKRGAA